MDGATRQERTRRVLSEVFGFASFRPGQAPVVDAILDGRDVLVVMPTGAGKSLCYQVPALVLGGLTIVVSPLVALMEDQVAALKLAGAAAEAIHSLHDRAENVAVWQRVAAGETRILYLSPERLMTERMLAALARLPISLIAVDEAHCISQWGPSFRPEYEALAALRERFPGVPIAAMTATADEATRRDIEAKLLGPDARSFVSGFDRPNIHLAVVAKRGWPGQLADYVAARKGENGIVYCLSRRRTEEAAEMLAAAGVCALPYHAGMSNAARAANQGRFLTERGIVMVATIAFGMGIDKPDIRYVFHTDIPAGLEAYYQEIGRAGRDGLPAEACMLYGLDDIRMRRRFIDEQDSAEDHKRREHRRLDALIAYCEAPECRRRTLLSYFGERSEPCGNCDVCREPVELIEASEDGRKAVAAVLRTGELFGAVHVIDVLRGTRNEKIERFGHDRLPLFGEGAGHDKAEWRSIIRQLVAAGFLSLDVKGYGGLAATEKGRALLAGEEAFRRRPDMLRPKGRTKRARAEAGPAADAPPLTAEEMALFDALKRLRLGLAQARGVPPYVIFSDRSLADMARRRPRTREAFAEVHGVGEAKLRDLAEPFLEAIAAAGGEAGVL